MTDFYDATNEREYQAAMQRRINDGSVWLFEGSVGRAAMAMIEDGVCCLGHERRRDYWGSTVPSRHDVKAGTLGSVAYVRAHSGGAHAHRMARI